MSKDCLAKDGLHEIVEFVLDIPDLVDDNVRMLIHNLEETK